MDALEILKEKFAKNNTEDWNEIRNRITSDPNVMDGLPVFKGTRLPVYIIFDYLAEGMKIEDILRDYPYLKAEEIRLSLKFAKLLSTIH